MSGRLKESGRDGAQVGLVLRGQIRFVDFGIWGCVVVGVLGFLGLEGWVFVELLLVSFSCAIELLVLIDVCFRSSLAVYLGVCKTSDNFWIPHSGANNLVDPHLALLRVAR